MAKKHHSSRTTHSKGKAVQHAQTRQPYWIWLGIGLGIAVLAVAAFFLTRPRPVVSAEISPAQAYEKFGRGAFFLDVRSAEEWAQIHIANSKLIPLDELKSRLGELPQDQDIVLVCLSGKRSKEGLTVLQQAGIKRAFCMEGGISAWKAAGYPVEEKAP
jgi:rhodanese-related sulfurtransferase